MTVLSDAAAALALSAGRPSAIATQLSAIAVYCDGTGNATITASILTRAAYQITEGRPASIATIAAELSDELDGQGTLSTATYTAALTKDIAEGRPSSIATNLAALATYLDTIMPLP